MLQSVDRSLQSYFKFYFYLNWFSHFRIQYRDMYFGKTSLYLLEWKHFTCQNEWYNWNTDANNKLHDHKQSERHMAISGDIFRCYWYIPSFNDIHGVFKRWPTRRKETKSDWTYKKEIHLDFVYWKLFGNLLNWKEKIGTYLAENSKDMLQLMIQDKSFVFQMLSKSATMPIFQQNQTNSEQQPQN